MTTPTTNIVSEHTVCNKCKRQGNCLNEGVYVYCPTFIHKPQRQLKVSLFQLAHIKGGK